MATVPRKIHTVTAGYLRRWAVNGRLGVYHAVDGRREDAGAAELACQRDYWGPPLLGRQVEQALAPAEGAGLSVIRKLSALWPLTKRARVNLAGFVAIQIIRTPAFGFHVWELGESTIRDVLAGRPDLSPAERRAAVEGFRSPHQHALTLLGQITRIGSLLSSMQWTLVEFDKPYLITSDQPVLFLPPPPANVSPAFASAPFGMSNTIEGRFTLDPQRMLLMTWHDGHDAITKGTRDQACAVNCSLAAQAVEEWFYRPHTTPQFHALPPRPAEPVLEPRTFPIAPQLLDGYTIASAGTSKRKAATDELINELIQTNAPRDSMRWVRVADAA